MMISQSTLLLRGRFFEEDVWMEELSDETKEIMQIIREYPALKLQIAMLALELTARAADREAEIR